MSRIAGALLAAPAVAALAWGIASWTAEDDIRVEPNSPEARRAVAVARDVVPGHVLGVYRDQDDGNWEVTITRDGRDYEVELAARDFTLLRLDYD